ncbi:MAG: hypothetical protein IPH30_08750 [Betaproteobacteria bacterium]|nr:hypothetical protein [Betaproteobacteria bacterium]
MSRTSLGVLSAFLALFAAIMWLSYTDADNPAIAFRRGLLAAGLSLGALGCLAGALSSNPRSWGRRLVAFVAGVAISLFAAFLPGMNKADPNWLVLVGSLFFFFAFGLPLLMYAMWGSTWGPLGRTDMTPKAPGTADLVLFRVRVVSSILVPLLFVAIAVYRVLEFLKVPG